MHVLSVYLGTSFKLIVGKYKMTLKITYFGTSSFEKGQKSFVGP